MVVYAHCSDKQEGFSPSFVSPFFHLNDFGAIGVDLFFVISGFIITMLSHKYIGKINAVQFLTKRIIRIAPIYWIVSAGWFFYDPNHGIRGWLKTIFFLPIFDFSSIFIKPVLFIGWTLSFEFYFYMVMAVVLALAGKKYIIHLITFFLVMIAVGQLFPYQSSIWTFITNPVIAEFVFGCLIWLLFTKYQQLLLKQTALILIVGSVLFLSNIFYMPSTNISDSFFILDGSFAVKRVLFWGIPSALLFFGVVLAEKKYAFTTPRWLVATGDASYSIYLVHLPLVKVFYHLWSFCPPLYSETLVIVTMFLVCFCGYLFYRIIERPLLSWLNRLILSRLKQTH